MGEDLGSLELYPRAEWKVGQGMPKFSDKALHPGGPANPPTKDAKCSPGHVPHPLLQPPSGSPSFQARVNKEGPPPPAREATGAGRAGLTHPNTHTHSQTYNHKGLSGLRNELRGSLGPWCWLRKGSTHSHTFCAPTLGATHALRHGWTPRAAAPLPDGAVPTGLVERGPGSPRPQGRPEPEAARAGSTRPARRLLFRAGPLQPLPGICPRSSGAPGRPRRARARRGRRSQGAGSARPPGRGRTSATEGPGSQTSPAGNPRAQTQRAGLGARDSARIPQCAGTAGPEEASPLTSWKVQRKMSVQRPEQQPMVSAQPAGAASAGLNAEPPAPWAHRALSRRPRPRPAAPGGSTALAPPRSPESPGPAPPTPSSSCAASLSPPPTRCLWGLPASWGWSVGPLLKGAMVWLLRRLGAARGHTGGPRTVPKLL